MLGYLDGLLAKEKEKLSILRIFPKRGCKISLQYACRTHSKEQTIETGFFSLRLTNIQIDA